ncbi:MAG: family transposase, partial [Rhodospirillales bacterium]|nr:family transposase [Rhodospirillales bacterium]
MLEDCIATIEAATARRDRLEAHIAAALANWSLAPVVQALQALRGVALVAAVTLIAELGDITRFANPRQLMAYLGLVPSENSSGPTRRQGGITKAGNGVARRMLIESAWSYRFPARMSRELLLRQEKLAKPIRDTAWKAQERLCRRYRRLARAGKLPTVTTAAIARELSGFAWAIAKQVSRPALDALSYVRSTAIRGSSVTRPGCRFWRRAESASGSTSSGRMQSMTAPAMARRRRRSSISSPKPAVTARSKAKWLTTRAWCRSMPMAPIRRWPNPG